MSDSITFERYSQGHWTPIAGLSLTGSPEQGLASPTHTGYLIDYAIDNMERRDAAALSATLPVSIYSVSRNRWPGFLVDLLPQGYGRAELLRRLGIPERTGHAADWQLLLAGAGNPIGHVRLQEAYNWLLERSQQAPTAGFTFEEVAARSDHFIEFLAQNGLFVAGSSGVQGEWPKILLTEDADGRLHLDHTLPDEQAHAHWLVKFGRGPDEQLARILSLEAPYMRLAQRLGARVHGDLTLRNRALFIPRFDRRRTPAGLERIAQESIASLCDIADFDTTPTHDTVVNALARVTTHPEVEITEYIRRDVLNVVLGNRDNHARNTAIQRFEDGTIRLSPLFDFAPMMLHPDGIARRSRWSGEQRGSPDWSRVIEQSREASGLPLQKLPTALRELAAQLDALPTHAKEAGVPEDILGRQQLSINETRESLARI